MTSSSTTNSTHRITQIDAYRSYAVFGLFIVHCVELFELHWFDPKPTAEFDTVLLLFAGKAFAMFALSFGISHFIISERAIARRESFVARYAWRLALLILIGLLHTAIYRGDILVLLGIAGLLLLPIDQRKNGWVLGVLATGLLVNVPLIVRLVQSYHFQDGVLALMSASNDSSMAAYMRGELGESIQANLGSGNLSKWIFMLESGRVAQIMGLFLLGHMLSRARFFTELDKFQFYRWVIIVIGGSATIALYSSQDALVSLFPPNAYWGTNFYASNLVAGWINLIFMIVQTAIFFEVWYLLRGRLLSALANAGRMSLTLYIGQSIVFVPILYNFGFGLWDDVTAMQMALIAVIGFAIQVAGANLWFRFFQYGPLEWIWRAATQFNPNLPIRVK